MVLKFKIITLRKLIHYISGSVINSDFYIFSEQKIKVNQWEHLTSNKVTYAKECKQVIHVISKDKIKYKKLNRWNAQKSLLTLTLTGLIYSTI